MSNFFTWLIAWILLLLLVYMVGRTKWGAPLVYYSLWLLILFMLVTHSQDIVNIFQTASIAESMS